MKEIAKTDYYTIDADETKNRLFLKIIGFWKSASLVPNYVSDIEKASKALDPGFTVLADLTEMLPMPKEIGPLHEQAQKALVDLGLKKTAEILPPSAILKMQVDKYAEASEMKKAEFSNRDEAETWLDAD